MAISVATIRDKMKAQLATISGLRVHDTWPAQVAPPCAIVKPTSLRYHESLGDATSVTFEVILLAAPADGDLGRGQDKLDGYLAESGASSIKSALEANPTLDGNCDDLAVTGWHDYGDLDVGGVAYLGVIFDVEVLT